MARQKSRKKQNEKQRYEKQRNQFQLTGLGDTMTLVGAWVAFHHPTLTLPVALTVWAVSCWERDRPNG
jgi:fermentation-respiration switch protein FrsA (DUF1100 family)